MVQTTSLLAFLAVFLAGRNHEPLFYSFKISLDLFNHFRFERENATGLARLRGGKDFVIGDFVPRQVVVYFFWMLVQISRCHDSLMHSSNEFLCSDTVPVGTEQKNFHEFFDSESPEEIDCFLQRCGCFVDSLKRDIDCFSNIFESFRKLQMPDREGFPLFWKPIED